MKITELTSELPAGIPFGSLPTGEIVDVVLASVDRVDLDAVAESLSDVASSAREAAGDLASTTEAASASGARLVTRSARSAAGSARRHPKVALSSLVLIGVLIALFVRKQRSAAERTSDIESALAA